MNHNILQKICNKLERPSYIYRVYYPYEAHSCQHFFYEYDMALKHMVRKCVDEYKKRYKYWLKMLCNDLSNRDNEKLVQKLIDICESKSDDICEIICAHLKEGNKYRIEGAYDLYYCIQLVDIH